jgi:hypothetical protein
MYLINLMFCFAAVYFMAQFDRKEQPLLFWANALSLVLNYIAFAMGVLA